MNICLRLYGLECILRFLYCISNIKIIFVWYACDSDSMFCFFPAHVKACVDPNTAEGRKGDPNGEDKTVDCPNTAEGRKGDPNGEDKTVDGSNTAEGRKGDPNGEDKTVDGPNTAEGRKGDPNGYEESRL